MSLLQYREFERKALSFYLWDEIGCTSPLTYEMHSFQELNYGIWYVKKTARIYKEAFLYTV